MIDTPVAIRHRTGAEWMKHIAGRALTDRALAQARAEREAIWREVREFLPCG
ncbi:hypothetical protein [Falsiroseomonas oryziterrae]|uniref:hypothetical protein n=1 Tax=Falsiroseomonas oryziterrae TaxID=2911368 RepID=UPI001F328AB9|nr:hypothetical protein [Roseomonas sp. NPKOSM-4]